MANYSEFQAANSQRQDEPASNDGGQLDTAGQLYSSYCIRPLVSLKPIADMG